MYMFGTYGRAQSLPFAEQWGRNRRQPCTMYGHCLNSQSEGFHLARRRRYDRYLTCLGCHGRYPLLARDVRCCRGIDLGRAGRARA